MLCLGREPLEGKLGSLCKVEEWHARLHFGCKECMLCVVLGNLGCHGKVSELCDLEAMEIEKKRATKHSLFWPNIDMISKSTIHVLLVYTR